MEFDLSPADAPLSRAFSPTPFVPDHTDARSERCELILRIQAEGLAKRMEHTHAACAVIGISGGWIPAWLAGRRARCKVLGRSTKDIVAITMPCFGTTHRTRSNAEILCEALGVRFMEINITNTVRTTLRTSARTTPTTM